jgi:hypothetical protein
VVKAGRQEDLAPSEMDTAELELARGLLRARPHIHAVSLSLSIDLS